jgi:hypothetical protein
MGSKRRFDLLPKTQATTTSPVPALKPIDNIVERFDNLPHAVVGCTRRPAAAI